MLSNKERKVMWYLYDKCKDKESVLIAPQEIVNNLMPKYEINTIEVDQIMSALVLDNYVEVVHSDSKGKLIYVVSLKPKGVAYERVSKHNKKKLYLLLLRTVVLATVSFIVGLILKTVFLS